MVFAMPVPVHMQKRKKQATVLRSKCLIQNIPPIGIDF